MAQITDPQIKAFVEQRINVVADHMAQLYNEATAILAEWNGDTGVQPNNSTEDVIDHGGTKEVTGADVHNIINRLTEYVAWLDDSGSYGKRNTVMAVATNTTRG